MGQAGQVFFVDFIGIIAMLRWPLGLLFLSVVMKYMGQLRPHERRHATLMFFYFFLIMSTYWAIKPIKKALLVGSYQATGWIVGDWHLNAAQVELAAKEMNAILALLATFLFAKLATRFKREKLPLSIIFLFSLGFAGFALLPNPAGLKTVWSFYFYGDFFVTTMVAAFFAFLNDSGTSRMARRLYGFIGLGGVLGGFFGSTVVATNVKQIELHHVAWFSVGSLILMAVMAWLSGKEVRPVALVAPVVPEPAPQGYSHADGGLVGGARAFPVPGPGLFHLSPYLLGIALIVGLYEMVSSIMEYQFTSMVLHFVSTDQIAEHFANVYSFTNFISLLLQLFLVRIIMTHVSMDKMLLLLPLTAFIGEVGFFLLPGLLFGSLLNTFGSAVAYSVNQSAKEALYVPMQREEKYKAKAIIDIFVFRFAKAVAVAVGIVLTWVFNGVENLRWLSLIVFVLIVTWAFVVRQIGPLYKRMVVKHA